ILLLLTVAQGCAALMPPPSSYIRHPDRFTRTSLISTLGDRACNRMVAG